MYPESAQTRRVKLCLALFHVGVSITVIKEIIESDFGRNAHCTLVIYTGPIQANNALELVRRETQIQ